MLIAESACPEFLDIFDIFYFHKKPRIHVDMKGVVIFEWYVFLDSKHDRSIKKMTAYSRFPRVIARSDCDVAIYGILEKLTSQITLDCHALLAMTRSNDGLVLKISKDILESSSFLFSFFFFFGFFGDSFFLFAEKENEFIQFFCHLHFLLGIFFEIFYLIKKQDII